MGYIEGFLLAVKSDRRDAYRAFAAKAVPIFKEHGALGVVECWGDDVPDGELTSFPMAVRQAPDETVVLGWVSWPSKAVRDANLQALREDRRFAELGEMPFDGKRMMFGGFEVILDA
jgi:uncharacterized protein YbaA (DUF1428 family)